MSVKSVLTDLLNSKEIQKLRDKYIGEDKQIDKMVFTILEDVNYAKDTALDRLKDITDIQGLRDLITKRKKKTEVVVSNPED